MKKLMATLFVLTFAMSTLAGCGQKEEAPAEEPAQVEAPAQEPTAEPAATEEKTDEKADEKTDEAPADGAQQQEAK